MGNSVYPDTPAQTQIEFDGSTLACEAGHPLTRMDHVTIQSTRKFFTCHSCFKNIENISSIKENDTYWQCKQCLNYVLCNVCVDKMKQHTTDNVYDEKKKENNEEFTHIDRLVSAIYNDDSKEFINTINKMEKQHIDDQKQSFESKLDKISIESNYLSMMTTHVVVVVLPISRIFTTN